MNLLKIFKFILLLLSINSCDLKSHYYSLKSEYESYLSPYEFGKSYFKENLSFSVHSQKYCDENKNCKYKKYQKPTLIYTASSDPNELPQKIIQLLLKDYCVIAESSFSDPRPDRRILTQDEFMKFAQEIKSEIAIGVYYANINYAGIRQVKWRKNPELEFYPTVFDPEYIGYKAPYKTSYQFVFLNKKSELGSDEKIECASKLIK